MVQVRGNGSLRDGLEIGLGRSRLRPGLPRPESGHAPKDKQEQKHRDSNHREEEFGHCPPWHFAALFTGCGHGGLQAGCLLIVAPKLPETFLKRWRGRSLRGHQLSQLQVRAAEPAGQVLLLSREVSKLLFGIRDALLER